MPTDLAGGSKVSVAALAGRAAARQAVRKPSIPATDNAKLDRANLAKFGFTGAEALRQTRAAAAQAAYAQSNAPQPRLGSIPKGYDTSAKGTLGRLQKALGVNPKSVEGAQLALSSGSDPVGNLGKGGRLNAGSVGTPFTYALSGLIQTAMKPSLAVAAAKDFGSMFQHPIGYAKREPLNALLNAGALVSGGATLGLRGARLAALGGEGGLADRLGLARAENAREALLRRPLARPPIRMFNDGSQGLYSQNPARFLIQKARDARSGGKPGLFVNDAAVNERMTEPVRQAYFGEQPPAPTTKSFGRATLGYLNKLQSLFFFGLKPSFIAPNVVGQEALMGMAGNAPVWDTLRGRKFIQTLRESNPRQAAAFEAAVSPSSIGGAFQQPRFNPAENPLLQRLTKASPRTATALGVAGKALDRGVLRPIDVASDIFSNHIVQRLIDRPQRLAALRKEFLRQGIPEAEIGPRMAALAQHLQRVKESTLNEPTAARGSAARIAQETRRRTPVPSAEVRRTTDVIRRANNQMLDYGGLSRAERGASAGLFIYPFTRAATKYAIRYPMEHPLLAAAQGEIGQAGGQQAKKDLGKFPSIAEGSIKVGERNVPGLGNVPLISNPQAAAILGQGPQFISQLLNLLSPHPSGQKALQITQNFSPLLMGALGGATGIDPQTGRSLGAPSLLNALQQAWRTTPEANLLRHGGLSRAALSGNDAPNIDPRKVLYPYGPATALERYATLGQGYPVPYNPVKGTALARAEDALGKSKSAQAELRGQNFLEDFVGKEHALGFKANAVPPVLKSAVSSYTAYHAAQNDVKKKYARDPRVVSSTGSLTQLGSLVALTEAGKATHQGPQQVRAALHLLGAYARILNQATAKRPYANGGAPLPQLNR